jgi:hypothetical protein
MVKKRVILFIIIIILLSIQIVPIIKNEIITYKYGKQFNGTQNIMISEIAYLKVLNYSDKTAKVYYVTKEYSSGNIVSFKLNDDGKWIETEWNTIWSVAGSASEMIWPYWWDTLLHSGL